jgi:hypothetical protein
MSPAAIYTAVRDLVILAVIGFIAWQVYALGADRVKLADMAAVTKQLNQNAAQSAAWQKESTDANAQRAAELAQVSRDIASHASPVYVVRNAPSAGPVPAPATAAGCGAPAGGGAHAGPGDDPSAIDIRPQIALFEQRYERALADCRALLNAWPQPEKPQ